MVERRKHFGRIHSRPDRAHVASAAPAFSVDQIKLIGMQLDEFRTQPRHRQTWFELLSRSRI